MSHDLGFFSVKQGATTSEIRSLYQHSCNGDEISWPRSTAFDSFVASLEKEYPCLDSLSDDEVDDSPWSCGFDKGDGHIIVSMVFSKAAETGNYIWGLLEQNELIVYDPQADKAYLGKIELQESQATKKWWQFWK
ncbi:hypothetical protein O0V09_18835 [Dasania sp. GY-19]|uniref:Uncharacterized protein n=1 Tax=Dasania phycosphaerae TaxID=2950436 RepID=A0A9J6RSB6_9GAMM|nr:hypothetical protein [Dasania phycosphaerae]MCZ0867258.1 hypothetical protein [Dasania phycosphaerae]